MDERPDNEMDRVLRANRALTNANMELVEADGTHIAFVTPVVPGAEPGDLVVWKGSTFTKVNGLRNIWRLTTVTSVTEV